MFVSTLFVTAHVCESENEIIQTCTCYSATLACCVREQRYNWEGVFSLCYSGMVCSLAHRCDPLSPWAAGFSRCMLGPAVLAPPFSGRTRSGRGCRSTTSPTRARLHLPLSLSHQTRDREIRYEPHRTFRTENRRD